MKGVAVAAAGRRQRAASGALTKSALKRTVTGDLASRPTSRDIKIDNFSMGMNGRELIDDCEIEITIGRRYGLLGQNGCGKTNFLECLATREVPIPDHIDIYHLDEEAEPTDRVRHPDRRGRARRTRWSAFEKLEEDIMENFGPEDERLEAIYERLDEIDPTPSRARGRELLHAPRVHADDDPRRTKDMSGGWRMRVALAQGALRRARRCCSSTSPPTTSTLRRACGSRGTWPSTRSASSSCATRRTSSTACAPTSSG